MQAQSDGLWSQARLAVPCAPCVVADRLVCRRRVAAPEGRPSSGLSHRPPPSDLAGLLDLEEGILLYNRPGVTPLWRCHPQPCWLSTHQTQPISCLAQVMNGHLHLQAVLRVLSTRKLSPLQCSALEPGCWVIFDLLEGIVINQQCEGATTPAGRSGSCRGPARRLLWSHRQQSRLCVQQPAPSCTGQL